MSDNCTMDPRLCQHCDRSCYLNDYGRLIWLNAKQPASTPTPNMTRSPLDPMPHFAQHGQLHVNPRQYSQRSRANLSKSRSGKWRHWIKTNRMVLMVLPLLLVTVVMPILWHIKMAAADHADAKVQEEQEDRNLNRIVRSLNAIAIQEQKEQLSNHNRAEHLINTTFPWLIQNHSLPNYFLHTSGTDHAYSNSAVVFLHQPSSGGVPITTCLQEIAKNKGTDKLRLWDSNTRIFWDTTFKAKNSHELSRFHAGQSAFGLCDTIDRGSRRCAYMTMFREPMERAVSSYRHCKREGRRSTDERCQIVDANEITLRDWILLQGSQTFQQLLYTPSWCPDSFSNHSLDGSSDVVRIAPAGEWPCWFKQRIHIEQLTAEDITVLVDYIVDHLDQWFSVIGLVSDWQNSVKLITETFRMPFSKCESLQSFSDEFDPSDNRANRHSKPDGYYDENDPEYLRYDYFVQKTLEPDVRIYAKAQKIFRVQKQMAFNTV